MRAGIALPMHVDDLLRSLLEVLADSIAVHVCILHFVLFVESNLAFKEHFTKVHHLQHIWDFEEIFEQLEPGSEHFADLSDLLPASLGVKLVQLLIHLELQLKSEEYCA